MASKILEKPALETTEEQPELTCIHHWLIDPPEGPISKGFCLKCGAEKEFMNYIPHSVWESATDDDEFTLDKYLPEQEMMLEQNEE